MGTATFFGKKVAVPIILVGPTASGKTGVSVELAKRLNGEIISADPMLVYKGFNIGTAKPTDKELKLVKHHLIDVFEPDEVYSAADFARDAKKIILDLLKKGKTPVVVSGTGFYITVLLNGIFPAPKPDWDLRKKLQLDADKHGNGFIHKKLSEIDPITAAKLHKNDRQRIIRAIELFELTGKPISYWKKFNKTQRREFDCIMFGLRRTRDDLYARVNERVDKMIENGFLDEVKKLLSRYDKNSPAFKGLGYKELVEFLCSTNKNLKESIEKIKTNTRRYVKRQITWFKREENIRWIDVNEQDTVEDIIKKMTI